MTENPYDILGVSPNASLDEVKALVKGCESRIQR